MKALLIFLCCCWTTSCCFAFAAEENDDSDGNSGQRVFPRRATRRRNYCHRNPSSQVVQDQFHFQGGVAHLANTVHQRISSPSSCQPILLSFFTYNSSASGGEQTWKNEDIFGIIEKFWSGSADQPATLRFQLDLSSNPSPEMGEKLKSLFLKIRRVESCYLFLIAVTPSLNSRDEQREMIPLQVKSLFQDAIGRRAWMSSSYFLLFNLNSASMLHLGQWATFRNKLEMVCVQSRSGKKDRLILQTFCSSCLNNAERENPILIESMDVISRQKLEFVSNIFPSFIKHGFPLKIVSRVLRTRTPVSVQRIQDLMDDVTPKRLLYWELKKSFRFQRNTRVLAWLNGVQKPGQRDFVEEIENGGALTIGLHFTPLYSLGSERIGFTFPYSEQRLGILAKRPTPFSKWQIIFREVQGSIVLIGIPIIVVTAFIIAGFRRGPPPLGSFQKYSAARRFLLIQWDWMVYFGGIFFSQNMFPALWKIAKSVSLIVFLVNMAGTLYTGIIRIHIATELATEEKADQIQSIFQLNPNFVKDGLLWQGGRLETNDELSRVLPFQNARAAEADKTSINMQYFYEPSSCVSNIITKERYICVAFEEYLDLVMPTLPLDLRRSLFIKSVNDLGISDWVTIAHNRDFPWANELTIWALSLVESGIIQFWMRNMSLAIPDDSDGGDDGLSLFENENEDVDSSAAQQEGLQRLAENFRSAIVIVVTGFLLELMVFRLGKCNWRDTGIGIWCGRFIRKLDRFYKRIQRKIRRTRRRGEITHLDFVR